MLATLRFRREHCARYRFRYSECSRCLDACPHEALTLTEEGVEIAAERCRNCALCAAACPTEAFVATNLPRNAVLADARGPEPLKLACAPSGQPGDVIVPCLGAVDAVALAEAGRRGVTVELHGSDHCADCEHAARGPEGLARALEAVERLREASAQQDWPRAVVIRRETPAAGAALHEAATTGHAASRRHLFRRLLGRGVDAIADAAQPASEPAAMKAIRVDAPVRMERRERLRATWPREEDMDAAIEPHARLPLALLAIERSRCTACEACARACPTAAIEVAESATAWGLVFRASRCVGCGVCVEVCQHDALAMAERIPAREAIAAAVTLHGLPKKRCSRCDRFFLATAGQEQCPTCCGDDEDFEALFG
ncbi:MAG: 4Fe-4S binding protein [Betaproteobacteria bacterium]